MHIVVLLGLFRNAVSFSDHNFIQFRWIWRAEQIGQTFLISPVQTYETSWPTFLFINRDS